MALHTPHAKGAIFNGRWERTGGPRRTSRYERRAQFKTGRNAGSHMPLDTGIHWQLRNPLNVIPAALLLILVIAVVGTVLTLL